MYLKVFAEENITQDLAFNTPNCERDVMLSISQWKL